MSEKTEDWNVYGTINGKKFLTFQKEDYEAFGISHEQATLIMEDVMRFVGESFKKAAMQRAEKEKAVN